MKIERFSLSLFSRRDLDLCLFDQVTAPLVSVTAATINPAAVASALLLAVRLNKKPTIKPNAPIAQLYHFLKSRPITMDVRPITPYMQNSVKMKFFILSSRWD